MNNSGLLYHLKLICVKEAKQQKAPDSGCFKSKYYAFLFAVFVDGMLFYSDYVINIDNLNTVTAFNCEPVFGNTRHFAFKYI